MATSEKIESAVRIQSRQARRLALKEGQTMQAIKLRIQISADHKIVVQLPSDVTAQSAEVIVLLDAPQPVPVRESLEALLERGDRSDRPRMSAVEIDRWIEQERNAWE